VYRPRARCLQVTGKRQRLKVRLLRVAVGRARVRPPGSGRQRRRQSVRTAPLLLHLKTAVRLEVLARGADVSLACGRAAVATPTTRRTALVAMTARTGSVRRTIAGP